MKRTYLKPAIATVATFGILAGSLSIYAQAWGGAGGGGGGGAAGGGAAGTGAAGGVTAGTGARSGSVGARSTGTATTRAGTLNSGGAGAQVGTARGLNTVGSASIAGPATTPPVGGATAIGIAPNAVGGSVAGNTFLSSPGGGDSLGAAAALPGTGAALNQQAIPMTSLPASVQSTLQGFSQGGQLGNVSQLQGANGPVYRASIIQNGQPMDVQLDANGRILSRSPGAVGSAPITAANATATTLNNAQAGLPLGALPQPVQNGISSQLGANGQVQTISRDDLANGSIYRVTANQNGVPTEYRFGSNGTLLSSGPLNGSATSTILPTAGALLPGSAVVMDSLPNDIQSSIRNQLGTARPNQITQLSGTNGMAYAVQYDVNGRPMLMTFDASGKVVNNVPISAAGAAANRTTGTGSSTTTTNRGTNSGRTTLRIDELPDPVQRALKDNAQYAEVRTVTREPRIGGDVYVVAVRGDNNVGELTIDANGKVLNDNRRNYTEMSTPKIALDDDRVTGIPFATVPVAIQDAVKAYAAASDIRSITLGTDRDGRTVYDVVYYRDGRRDRMIVAKDGTLRRIDQNVSPLAELPNPNKPPVLAIGDLPPQARDTIRRETEHVLVKEIGTRKVGNENVYKVRYETNGAPVELLVSTDGRVVLPQGTADRDDATSPLPAPVSREELRDAKVVNEADNRTTSASALSAVGAAATRERGAVSSSVADNDTPATSKVDLADVPAPVQTTAKRLASGAPIEAITPKLDDTGVKYEVAYSVNGVRKTVVMNKDGAVISE